MRQPSIDLESSAPPARTGSSILIVDDDVDVRDALKTVLDIEGYSVICASDGNDALEKLTSVGPSVGLILLDLMMPGMDGWEFRRRQRRMPSAATVPVIVISAAENPAQKLADLAPDAFLGKPLGIETLLETIRAVYGRPPE